MSAPSAPQRETSEAPQREIRLVDVIEERAAEPIRVLPYVARAAVCFMMVEHEGDDDALYNRLTEALRSDSRVEVLKAPKQVSEGYRRLIFSSFGSFSDDGEVAEREAPDPFSHIHAFTFRRPIVMQIRSPRRLQPVYSTFKHIPADHYWAAWDGITLTVLWELEDLESDESIEVSLSTLRRALSPSGGLLAQSILEGAAHKCDVEFKSIACSPNCGYKFSHANMVITTVGEGDDSRSALFHEKEDRLIRVDLPVEHDPEIAVLRLQYELGFIGRVFARLRCSAQTIENASWLAHGDVADLLKVNYDRAAISAEPFWKTLRVRWVNRKWRREARRFIARICLDLATLENVRGDWARSKQIYDESTKDGNVGIVFASEYVLGTKAVSTIDTTEARSAIERMTGSLDTRALVLATAIGAIAGALVGALIGTLL